MTHLSDKARRLVMYLLGYRDYRSLEDEQKWQSLLDYYRRNVML